MITFQYVEVNSDNPFERGLQYGEQAVEKIKFGVESYREFFSETSNRSWKEIKEYALSYTPIIEETMPEMLDEAKGIAAGAGVDIDELMVLNCRYEITKFPNEEECTTCAVLPEASKGNKTLLFKNWDLRAGIIDNIIVLKIKGKNSTRLIGLTEAGQLMRDGFNSYGVGLCNNSLQSIHDNRGIGIPVTFLRRKALSCKTFEELKILMLTSKRSVSCNTLLASKDGKAVDIEAYPGGADLIKPVDGIVAHANHFITNPKLNALEDKVTPRGDRLRTLLKEKHGCITVDYIKKCMCDHENYPKAICRHPSDVSIPLERRGITVATMIFDFNENAAHICAGPPCQGKFIEYRL